MSTNPMDGCIAESILKTGENKFLIMALLAYLASLVSDKLNKT